jgi:hypothetical protein
VIRYTQAMRRSLKYLRIAMTALSLTACVLLIALWVRSYHRCEYLYHGKGQHLTIFGSNAGSAYLLRKPLPQLRPRLNRSWKYNDTAVDRTMNSYQRASGEIFIRVPYMALIALFMTAACSCWIRWSRRFSLRTLLIATTLVAVALAAIVYASR